MELRDYLRIFGKNKWLIAGSTILCATAALVSLGLVLSNGSNSHRLTASCATRHGHKNSGVR
jgi:hypothetical protein